MYDYSNLKGKKLLLLGGVRPACEIIKEAKSMGVITYVTDYLVNSPAKKIADYSFEINAMDVDAVIALCKEQKIDGMITGYVDSLLPYYEEICENAGFYHWGNKENIEICINKDLFKRACEESGVPVVPYVVITPDDKDEKLKQVNCPVVFKPIDNSGSRGITKCYLDEEKDSAFEKALSFSKEKKVMAEKLMDINSEFSAYYIMNHGEAYFSGMGDRIVTSVSDDIAPTGLGQLFPSAHINEWLEKYNAKMLSFFRNNQMNNGFAFVQGFYEAGDFYIHEIGYRLNGGFCYKIFNQYMNYNQVKELISFSLTGEMSKIKCTSVDWSGHGLVMTIPLKNGTIDYIGGIDDIKKNKGVIDFCQLHDLGDSFNNPGTTAQVFAYALLYGDTIEEISNTVNYIKNTLVVKNKNDENMIFDLIKI